MKKTLAFLICALLALTACAGAEDAAQTTAQGEGYTLTYDAHLYGFYRNGVAEGVDLLLRLNPSDGDAACPAYLQIAQAEDAALEESSLLSEGYQQDGEAAFASNLTARVFRLERSAVAYTCYLVASADRVYTIKSACAADESAQADSLAQTAATFALNDIFARALYLPNADATGLVRTQVDLPLEPDALLGALYEAGALSQPVTANAFEIQDKTATLDLSAAFGEMLRAAGSTGEALCLYSVVDTFAENYALTSLQITCDSAVIETGHNRYDQPLTPGVAF